MQKTNARKRKVQTKLYFKITQHLLEIIHPKVGVESMARGKECVMCSASVYRCWKPTSIHKAVGVTKTMKHKTMNTKICP
jgi:hypothetical protein